MMQAMETAGKGPCPHCQRPCADWGTQGTGEFSWNVINDCASAGLFSIHSGYKDGTGKGVDGFGD
jgi:hypothetical protein